MENKIEMEPGIYHGISFDDYKLINAVNQSSLKHMVVSAKKYKHMLNREYSSSAMAIGSAVHTAILEPSEFESKYSVYDGTRRGNAWDEFKNTHSDSDILTQTEMSTVENIVSAVKSHQCAMKYMLGGDAEVTIVFIEPSTGIKCKARLDYIDKAYRFFTDLKTTRDVSHDFFQRQIAQLQYHFQFGFYRMGLHILTGVWVPAKCIAAQNCEPFDVVPYNISSAAMDKGASMVLDCLHTLKTCIESDTWPGISDDEVELDLPSWAYDYEEEEITV